MSRKPETTGQIKTIKDVDVSGKRVLVRLDVDVPVKKLKLKSSKLKVADETRLLNSLETVQYLVDRRAKITIIGHLGRPNGKRVEELSMEPVAGWFETKFPGAGIQVEENLRFTKFPGAGIQVEENLRFDPGEEECSPIFAQNIVRRLNPEVYIFDAFAAYRPHASVVLMPKLVPCAAIGFRFEAEMSHLSKVLINPKKPVIFILGGAKADTKITLIPKLAEAADGILIGGLLPDKVQSYSSKLKVAELNEDGLDISVKSASEFADIIMKAGTVVWNGPMGAFENSQIDKYTNRQIDKWEEKFKNTPAWGTYLVAKAMNQTKAYAVVGGGDTEAALTALGLEGGIDWISSGGGAMLYYLANGTLPFLEAVK